MSVATRRQWLCVGIGLEEVIKVIRRARGVGIGRPRVQRLGLTTTISRLSVTRWRSLTRMRPMSGNERND